MSGGGLEEDEDEDEDEDDGAVDDGGGCAELHGNQDILLYITYIIFCFVGGKWRHCAVAKRVEVFRLYSKGVSRRNIDKATK